MAVVYPVSALALRMVVTPTSAFSFLHEALYDTSNQLLLAPCRVLEDSRILHVYADDVGCAVRVSLNEHQVRSL